MQGGGEEDRDALLAWFLEATGGHASADVARDLLQSCDWDAGNALTVFNANREEEAAVTASVVRQASRDSPASPLQRQQSTPRGRGRIRETFWDIVRSALAFLRSLQPPSLLRALLPSSVPLPQQLTQRFLGRLPPMTFGRIDNAMQTAKSESRGLLIFVQPAYSPPQGPILEEFLATPATRTLICEWCLLHVINTGTFESHTLARRWLRCNAFPHLSFWVPCDGTEQSTVLVDDVTDPMSGFRRVGAVEGNNIAGANDFLASTISAVQQLRESIARREQRVEDDRLLRQQQDEAYRQVLARENAVEQEKKLQAEVAKKAAQKAAVEVSRAETLAKLGAAEFVAWASTTAAASTAAESSPRQRGFTALRVRLPDGSQLQRVFPTEATLLRVFQWLECVRLAVTGGETKSFDDSVAAFLKNAVEEEIPDKQNLLGSTVPAGGAAPRQMPQKFYLATAFPARSFRRTDPSEIQQSLKDLNLVAASLFVHGE